MAVAWQQPSAAGTGAVPTVIVTAGQPFTFATMTTTAAAGCLPPVTMHYGTDAAGGRYTAMTSMATAQAAWGIQYIARAYGGEEVTARGLTWRVRPLTMGELTGGDAE